MGFFTPSYKQVGGLDSYLSPLSGFGQQYDLGAADFGQRQAKGLLKQLGQGNYDNLLGSYLSPLRDQAQVNQRENERDLQMGANAFQQGAQPGLMAALGNESRLKTQEQLGMQLASAVPQLYGAAQGAFNAGRGRQISEMGLDEQAREAALRGKIGGNQMTPSIFSSTILPLLQSAGGIMGGLGSLGVGSHP